MDYQVKEFIIQMGKCAKIKSKSEHYQFGFAYFGPLLYGYTKWLFEMVNREKVNKLFFFSRDGYMMKKAFHLLYPKSRMDSKYVYVSRQSLRQALLWNCNTYEDSLKYLTNRRYLSFSALLEYYGFGKEEKNKISNETGIELNKEFPLEALQYNKQLRDIYKNIYPRISEKSKKQDDLLKQYLRQIDFTGSCAIIDIGWHGSMQYYLEEFIKLHHIDTNISGFYMGISPLEKLYGKTYGYLYDKNDFSLRKSVLCFHGGFEKLFQSCEGSTCGYQLKQERVVPIKQRYEYEGKRDVISSIHLWQKAALEYIQKMPLKQEKIKDQRAWAYPIIKFGKAPSNRDIQLFSSFYIEDGKKEYFISQKRIYQYTPTELLHALSGSTWKTGFLKSLFHLPLPYYSIYNLLRK